MVAKLMVAAQLIDQDAVRVALQEHGFDWQYSLGTDSTNADVLAYHERHQRQVVAVSEMQNAGRGRRGRQWVSPFARNIYCTIGIVKALPASSLGLISIVTGIALCRALRARGFADVLLKWPNDLLSNDLKLGGILIESRALQNQEYLFAIGFGLNVLMDAQELAAIARPATSLAQICAQPLNRTQVLIAALESVIPAVQAFDANKVQQLIGEFREFDSYHDRDIEVICGDDSIRGINRGIAADGQLRLETPAGMHLYSAAEISLRLLPR